MSREKQIEEKAVEEMAKVIEITEQIARDAVGALPSPRMYAKDLYWKGYRKQSDIEHILSDLKKELHDKAVFPNNGAVSPYINLKVLDAVIQKHIDKIKGDI